MNKALLKDISTKISSGLTPLRSNPEFWNTQDISWVKTEQLGIKYIYDSNEKISKVALKNTSLKLNPINSLSIAMYGEGKTRGSISILKNEMATNQACCNIVIDSEKADYEYVYYFLKNQYKNLRNLSSGVRKNLNSNNIKNFEIRFPENLSEQIKISTILSNLDKKIELNNKINTELEAMAKLIYDYWFVQFEFPDANGKPYKSSGGKMVYNDVLKREIPEGWDVFSLSSILKSNYSTIAKKDLFEEIDYLDTGNLTKNRINITELINTKNCKIPSRAKRVVNKNDILYSTVRPNLCHYGIIKNPTKNMIASTGFIQLSSNINWISNDLIYTFLTSLWITKRLQQIASLSVSAYPSISPNDILSLNIPLPKNGKNTEFINSKLNNIYLQISSHQKQNQKLAELRDWLLPMLMNGQVTIK